METTVLLEDDLEDMRMYYRSGKTRGESWRRSQLQGLLLFLKKKEGEIFEALAQDLGKHPIEAYRDEVGSLTKSVNYALNCLSEWMSSKKAKLPLIAILTTAEIVPEPLGLVLVISTWNFPIGLSLEPLIGALAAGNCVVLKPSELTPKCSFLLATALPTFLDGKAVKVVEGDSTTGERLLRQKWDKILFTGSSRIAREVLAAAAEHLTPVVLELGGKCPVILDSFSRSWDKEVAAQRITWAKFNACAGQACIAVDYVLVEERFIDEWLELMKTWIKKLFGENPKQSCCNARIINKHHFTRLRMLLEDPKVQSRVVHGGDMDEDNLYIEPTILLNPPLQSAIMMDEIFGPLLPIITVKNIEDSIQFISSRPKPLAIYVFTERESFRQRIQAETSSGSLIFNDVIIQYLADTLPFGGIGESGMGKYHGKFSFDTFSHHKAVVRRSLLVDFWFRFPPWNEQKLQLLRSAYDYDYLGLLLIVLGLKRSS
ncbi:hypothetical protein MLD38_011772 [Melastoma candidum]|uniref:Uncharacterized protein n=1 Tax=Melastoma candidum TaxID=119954 RepID=A0ACB9R752_9MYRT|nr:hypothetical protein MLD38_011772 [Melastoma candidum]